MYLHEAMEFKNLTRTTLKLKKPPYHHIQLVPIYNPNKYVQEFLLWCLKNLNVSTKSNIKVSEILDSTKKGFEF